jgi:hypothetical protein
VINDRDLIAIRQEARSETLRLAHFERDQLAEIALTVAAVRRRTISDRHAREALVILGEIAPTVAHELRRLLDAGDLLHRNLTKGPRQT